MGVVLSAPMVLIGIWCMATARPVTHATAAGEAQLKPPHHQAHRDCRPPHPGQRATWLCACSIRGGLLHDTRRPFGMAVTAPEVSGCSAN